jgi:hypothetical protein
LDREQKGKSMIFVIAGIFTALLILLITAEVKLYKAVKRYQTSLIANDTRTAWKQYLSDEKLVQRKEIAGSSFPGQNARSVNVMHSEGHIK